MPGSGGADCRAPLEAGKRTRVWLELTQSLQGVKERTWWTASNLDPSPTCTCGMPKQPSHANTTLRTTTDEAAHVARAQRPTFTVGTTREVHRHRPVAVPVPDA